MKIFILGLLLLLPLAVSAQDVGAGLEAALKQMEKMKAGMTPEQRKQFEASGTEQKLRDTLAKLREAQQKQEQDNKAAALQTANKGKQKIPEKPALATAPEAPANKDQLVARLQSLSALTARTLSPPAIAALQPLLNQPGRTGQLAMVFWANNELGQALYLLENACLTAPDDFLALNNLGALLTLSGCPDKSLPLLLYAQKHGPAAGTLLNNVGQAWLSLGYVEQAQQALQATIEQDPDNAEAQRSLALLAAKQGNVQAFAAHLQQVVGNSGGTSEDISLLQQAAPDTDIPALIRPHFRQFYKDRTITRRFHPPTVPASYAETLGRRDEIESYLQNLSVTAEAARKTAGPMQVAFQKNLMQSMTALQTVNPLREKASLMMAELANPRYSTSYPKRLQRADEERKTAVAEVQKSLAKYGKKIAELRKESGKIEGGEGDIEGERRLEEIQEEICALNWQRQSELLPALARVNTEYLRTVEDLLHQRLQEETFWTQVAFSPLDVSIRNYEYYAAYLRDLNKYARAAYPDAGQLSAPCKEKSPAFGAIGGKLQSWEMDHCDLNIDVDVKVARGQMNCSGWKISADFKAGEFEYNRSVDPVTWETTGHSISAKAGKEREFDLGRNLKGTVGADVKTTISFDADMRPTDLAVTAAASASVNGPLGASASAGLGSMEVSVSGGYNSSGPSIPGF